jgi:flavin reductase (DIM6/NTAB) family NADH-FMN oxidoreductase RutF
MSANIHWYEPAKGHGLRHNPFKAIVVPRPIGWISTRSRSGVLNVAPYSFFNAFSYEPPIVGFATNDVKKDSLINAEETGEFVFNLVTKGLAERMNATAAAVGPDVSEFELAGLTPGKSRIVSAPRVEESPVSFECKCSEILQLKTANGNVAQAWLVLGEVVGVHIDTSLIKDGVFSTVDAQPLARGGGTADYFWAGSETLIRMQRPA